MRGRLYARSDQVRGHLRALQSSEACLPEVRHRLGPAENLFDSLSEPLTDRVALMPRRPAIDREAAGARDILCNMRRDVQLAAALGKAVRVETFVTSERDVPLVIAGPIFSARAAGTAGVGPPPAAASPTRQAPQRTPTGRQGGP